MDHLNMTSKNYLKAETTSKNSRRGYLDDDEKAKIGLEESVVGGWGRPGAGYIVVLAYSVLFSKNLNQKF